MSDWSPEKARDILADAYVFLQLEELDSVYLYKRGLEALRQVMEVADRWSNPFRYSHYEVPEETSAFLKRVWVHHSEFTEDPDYRGEDGAFVFSEEERGERWKEAKDSLRPWCAEAIEYLRLLYCRTVVKLALGRIPHPKDAEVRVLLEYEGSTSWSECPDLYGHRHLLDFCKAALY